MPQIGANIPLSLLGNKSNCISLIGSSGYTIPAGMFLVVTGPSTVVQFKDPVTGLFRAMSGSRGTMNLIRSDGFNYRLFNITGGVLGGLITNAGTGYTSAPTVVASAGASVWQAIVGGANNATVTVTAGGSGYVYPPIILIDPPPNPGIQATATCTLSSGAVNAVTMTNVGAGYKVVPNFTVINDPRDTAGSGAILTGGALGTATVVTGVVCTDPGNAVTAVPTLTFSGGGGSNAAATVVCAFAATGITVTAGGAGYGNAQPFMVTTVGGQTAGSATLTNPMSQINLINPVRPAWGSGTSTAGGAITATGFTFTDPGLFTAVPNGIVIVGGTGLATGQGTVTITVGGVQDDSWLMPIGGA